MTKWTARPAHYVAACLALLAPVAAHAQDGLADVADSGDTAWILVSSAFVLLMTMPGLTLFYGGLVRAKNFLAVCLQVGADRHRRVAGRDSESEIVERIDPTAHGNHSPRGAALKPILKQASSMDVLWYIIATHSDSRAEAIAVRHVANDLVQCGEMIAHVADLFHG